jgi:hypothetical protein
MQLSAPICHSDADEAELVAKPDTPAGNAFRAGLEDRLQAGLLFDPTRLEHQRCSHVPACMGRR